MTDKIPVKDRSTPVDCADEVRRALFRAGSEEPYADALLYDHTWRHRRADVDWYAELADEQGGPVLELGVGTGRVAFAIARRAVDVLGLDVMPGMIARAEQRRAKLPRRVAQHVELRVGDARTARLGRRFGLVIAPFNAFMHLFERSDWEAALASARRHLVDGGLLAFDVRNPDPYELARDPDRVYRGRPVKLPDGRTYRYGESFAYDAVRQVEIVTQMYDCEAEPAASFRLTLAQRQLWPEELEALLHYNGFAIERRCGDFDGGPFDQSSEVQVVVARPI